MPREVVQAHIKTGAPCALADRENDEVQVSDELFERMMNVLRDLALGRHVNWTDSRQQRPTICLVPDELRLSKVVQKDGEHQGYKPVALRISPRRFCIYGNLGEAFEVYKWGSVQQLINQHSSLLLEPARTPALLLSFLESMMRIVPEIYACYEISNSDRRYVEHYRDDITTDVLLGGCFVLHRLLEYAEINGNRGTNQCDQDHGWAWQGWAWQFVTRDLLLLQNQIPFLAVRELFQQLRNDKPEDKDALVTGSLRLFRSFCPELMHSYPRSGPDIAQVHHLLHLFYLSVVHDQSQSWTWAGHHVKLRLPELAQWIPSAKVLEDSGVRFRRMKHAKSFLDISFDVGHGILEIPRLQLYDHSDALFRNLIAFEQTCPGIGRVISAYAIFMDCLIKAPEDMRILNQRGILVSRISGDQNDSGFFSRISAHVPMPADNYLAALMNDVSKNKDYRRHKWYAELVRSYCGNPWVAMSVFAAVLLLCLTVLQTFFTVYPYYNPRD